MPDDVGISKQTLNDYSQLVQWNELYSTLNKIIVQYQIKNSQLWGAQYRIEKVIHN